ncbi:MAG: DHCW motif cupin fold protein [Gemmatimonadetes bacterium]|nr:DHCW motif cupin fold protein [Gemmatimonadota bacterium]
MKIDAAPFVTTDWEGIPAVEVAGTSGTARRRTVQLGEIRVRLVEYSPGYVADHWCEKGHVVFCLEGAMQTELRDGRTLTLRAGMSYQVGDGVDAHRSSTVTGAKLFIVD